MILSPSLVLLSVIAAGTPLVPKQSAMPDLHQSVRNVLAHIPALQDENFTKDIRLSVAIQSRLPASSPMSKHVKKIVLGTAYGVLDSLGIRPLQQTLVLDDQDSVAIELLGRATGADWLLTFVVSALDPSTHQIKGELRKIDAGLWGPLISPTPIYGTATQVYASGGVQIAEKSPTSSLRKIHELKERIVAIQACEIVSDSPGLELVTLSNQKLAVFATDSDYLTRLAEMSLSSFPRATRRSRFPQGHIICSPRAKQTSTTLSFAHTDLEQAMEVQLDHRGSLKLSPAGQSRHLSFKYHDKKSFEAAFAPGRPWWGKLSRDGVSKATAHPIIEFASLTASKTLTTYVVTQDYQVSLLAPELQLKATSLSSGTGFSVYTGKQGNELFVTTSSTSRLRSDLVRIRTLQGDTLRELEVPIPVRASATVPGATERSVHLFMAGPQINPGISSIYHVEVLNE